MSDKTVLMAMPSLTPTPVPVPPGGRPPGGGFGLAALLALGLGIGQAPAPGHANPLPAPNATVASGAGPCAAPRPGRYAVMGEGELNGEPLARLLLETWNSDGSLKGVRLERRGRAYRETAYTGSFRPLSNCRVAIERTYLAAVSNSQAVLDLQGRPRHSLGVLPDVLMVSRWFVLPQAACTASLLDGVAVSQQLGSDWRERQWKPNAVVQREQWSGGQVKGMAVSSYGPRVEEATYSGSIAVQPDCLATIRQKDSLGVSYNYRAIVLADGSGYLYLQTDPDDVTVAFVQRLSTGSPQPAAW
jgi:hypothetical protein